jgi:two-component system OmpR family sensor kinase
MVDELITLARSERPDILRSAPLDVGVLIDDVYDKAHTLGDRQ